MKIGMIGHKRIPSREGGVEIVVEELATRMVKDGHKVVVYNRKGNHVSGKSIDVKNHNLKEYKGIKIVNVPTSQKKSLNALIYSVFATIRALFGHYDVVHYHAEGPCAMLPILHFFGIKTVATIHGLDWQRAKWGGFATKYLLFGEKMAAKYADEVIVLSENVKKYFKDTYGRDVLFIPNGVCKPTVREVNLIQEKHGLQKDEYFLFLARIVPEKGVHYLIEAFKQIDTDKKLVIAGGSSHSDGYMDEVKKLAATDERIILTGFIQGTLLEELYSNAYAYVLPSDIEGMPLSLLEAMSYGNCCIVSNIPENVEVVEEHAISFEKSNVNDLREKIRYLIENPNRQKELKSTAAEFILKKYNWNKIVEKTLNVYRRIK